MLLLICALALCLTSVAGLRRGFAVAGPIATQGFDGIGVLTGFVVTCAAAMVVGPLNGLALLVALMLHELGHWLALQIIGHAAPVLRFLPALGTREAEFDRDIDRLFHALMGPGLSVAPMVLAVALAPVVPAAWAEFCRALALSFALVGCISLLPFRRCDGGVAVQAVARALSPSVIYLAGASGIAGLTLFGLSTGLVWTYVVAGLGLAGLILRPTPTAAQPMAEGPARLGFLAWAACFGAHVAGGAAVLYG